MTAAQWDGMTEADHDAQITSLALSTGTWAICERRITASRRQCAYWYRKHSSTGARPFQQPCLRNGFRRFWRAAETRERVLYGETDPAQIGPVLRSYRDCRGALRAHGSRDGTSVSHHRELLARSHPTPKRRVRCVPTIQKTESGAASIDSAVPNREIASAARQPRWGV